MEDNEHARHQHILRVAHDGVTSHIHNGALVCSGNRNFTGDLTKVKEYLEREVGMYAEWVEENNGIVGHIKGLVEFRGPVYTVSTTGGEATCKEMPVSDITIDLVAIVFNIDMERMESRMASLLDACEKT